MRTEINAMTGERTELPDAEVVPQDKAILLSDELKVLSAEYKADTLQLNLDWLTAMVNDGAIETAKKAAIVQKRADRLAKLTADMSAAKLKYA